MARQRSVSGVVALIGLAVVVIVGLVWWRARAAPNQTAFIGDSITDLARGDIEARFSVDDDHVKAVGGKTIQDMMIAVPGLAAGQPKRLLVNLGTNDVLSGEPTEQNWQELETMLAGFPGTSCQILVNINEHMISPGGHDAHGLAVGLNQKMREWAAGSPNRKVVDWAKIVSDADAAGKPDGPLTFDTVHPTELGQRRLLDAYDAAIGSCPTDVL